MNQKYLKKMHGSASDLWDYKCDAYVDVIV